MKDLTITFSHLYYKMPVLDVMLAYKTELLHVFVEDIGTIGKEFREYDTHIYPGFDYYPLPKKGRFLILILYTHGFLWTTMRRWTQYKEKYYCDNIGKDFKIFIIKNEP
jgi:hypothetical protein